MSKGTLTFIAFLLTLSALGITGFQTFWLLNAIEVKDAQVNREIQQVLDYEVASLENKEAKSVLLSSIQQSGAKGASIQIIREAGDTSQQANEVHIFTINSDSGLENRVDYEVLDTITDILSEKVKSLSGKLQEMAEEVIRKQLDTPLPINERIDLASVQENIKNALSKSELPYDFEIGLLLDNNQKVESLVEDLPIELLKNSPFKASMFQQDLYPSEDQLVLYFPNLKKDVLSSMIGMLMGSGFFLLLILGTYILTIRTLFRQKRVSDIKTDFINNMTHEFKTPVATVGLAVDALENPKVYGSKKQIFYYTGIIRQENRRMNQHVENVLQMALVDKKDFKLKLTNHDIHKVLEEVKGHMTLNAQQQNGDVVLDLKAEQPILLMDANHIKNVLVNLVDNALKYTNGNPIVEISTHMGPGYLMIQVKDNGIGMTPETQQQIFGKFFRLASGDIHNVKGFGLGLSYSKAIVLAHGGEIDVTSVLGQGSIFKLKLAV